MLWHNVFAQIAVKKISILERHSINYLFIFLKIDVQGFEQEVLKGASEMIALAKGIEMEISLVPLYENQTWLLPQVLEYMEQKGFVLTSIVPAFTDNVTGKVLQCNGIFYKK